MITVAAKFRAQAYIDTNLSFQQWNDLYFQQWNDLSNGRLDELRIMDRYLRVSSLIPEDRNEVDMLRLYLTKELDIWNTTLGPVSFSIERDYNTDDAVGAGLKTVLDFGGSVLCYIGLQLMLVIAGGDIFLCSACGAPYIRPRGRTAPEGCANRLSLESVIIVKVRIASANATASLQILIASAIKPNQRNGRLASALPKLRREQFETDANIRSYAAP